MAGSVMFISGSALRRPRRIVGLPARGDWRFAVVLRFRLAEFRQLSDVKDERIRQSVRRFQPQFARLELGVGSDRDLRAMALSAMPGFVMFLNGGEFCRGFRRVP